MSSSTKLVNQKRKQVEKEEEEENDEFYNELQPVNWSTLQLEPIEKHIFPCEKQETFAELNDLYAYTETEYSFVKKVLSDTMKFNKPTPVQSKAWPIALQGKNIIGIAKTGSGKTMAFLIPAILHSLKHENQHILINAPTRELAQQIHAECSRFESVIQSICIYGGEFRKQQIKKLKLMDPKQALIIVATPGRLLDYVIAKVIDLKRVSFWVLDEADKMLEMGFQEQVTQIHGQIRPDRQLLLFSATWSEEVQEIAKKFNQSNSDYVQLTIQSQAQQQFAQQVSNIKQQFIFIQEKEKEKRILQVLDKSITLEDLQVERILIFCQTKKTVDQLTAVCRSEGWPCLGLHGDRSQMERDWIVDQFRQGKTNIMIATDVASRGLDIPNIKYVINYDLPHEMESYIHRIGRTGRANQTGTAISFFTPQNIPLGKALLEYLKQHQSEDIPPQLIKLVELKK